MKKITKVLLSSLFILGSFFLFTRNSQATNTKLSVDIKKPNSLVLRHHRDLKKGDMIAWSYESDAESGRSHGSHYSHGSHSSHYSHYSSS